MIWPCVLNTVWGPFLFWGCFFGPCSENGPKSLIKHWNTRLEHHIKYCFIHNIYFCSITLLGNEQLAVAETIMGLTCAHYKAAAFCRKYGFLIGYNTGQLGSGDPRWTISTLFDTGHWPEYNLSDGNKQLHKKHTSLPSIEHKKALWKYTFRPACMRRSRRMKQLVFRICTNWMKHSNKTITIMLYTFSGLVISFDLAAEGNCSRRLTRRRNKEVPRITPKSLSLLFSGSAR